MFPERPKHRGAADRPRPGGRDLTVHVRHSRAASLLAASVLALGTAAVAGTAPAAQAAEPGSPLTLWAPDRLTAYS